MSPAIWLEFPDGELQAELQQVTVGSPRAAAVALCPGPRVGSSSQSSAPCRDQSPWGLASSKAMGGSGPSLLPLIICPVWCPPWVLAWWEPSSRGHCWEEGRNGKKGAVTAPTVPGTAWAASSVHRAVRAVCKTLFCR